MPVFNVPQDASPDVRRANPQGQLVIHGASTAAAEAAYLNKALVSAGAINIAATYVCNIRTDDWSVVEVVLMPSAVTGAVTVKIQRMYENVEAMRTEAAGAAFVAATAQTLTRIDLNGSKWCRISFTVPGGGSVTFARGTDPTAPTAIAEYNGA